MTLAGKAGNFLTINSSTTGTAALINPSTASVSYVKVSDNNNIGAAITPSYASNLGGNTNWVFSSNSWQGSGGSNSWKDASVWSNVVFPSAFDNVIIASKTGVYPTIDMETTIANLTVSDSNTLTIWKYNFTVTGTTTVGGGTSGVLSFSSASATRTFLGAMTFNNGASMNVWGNFQNIPMTFSGGIINSSDKIFNVRTGIIIFNGNNQSLTEIFNIANVKITGITMTNNNTLTIGKTLTGT